MMEGFICHDQLHKTLQHWIARMLMQVCESAHGLPFQKHMHAEEFLVNNWRLDQSFRHVAQDLADQISGAPT